MVSILVLAALCGSLISDFSTERQIIREGAVWIGSGEDGTEYEFHPYTSEAMAFGTGQGVVIITPAGYVAIAKQDSDEWWTIRPLNTEIEPHQHRTSGLSKDQVLFEMAAMFDLLTQSCRDSCAGCITHVTADGCSADDR